MKIEIIPDCVIFTALFARRTSRKKRATPSSSKTEFFGKELYHILPGQIFFSFSDQISSNGVEAEQCHLGSLEISWQYVDACIYLFQPACAHPASGILTFAQSRCPDLSPFETQRQKRKFVEISSEAFNSDLLVSVMNTQRS